MPDPVTGLTAGATGLSYLGAKDASAKASKSSRGASRFRQKQYNDWKAIYGPVEELLSEYYSSLTPDALIAQGLQTQQLEYQRAETQIKENLTQRGLDDSGVAEAADQNLILQNALARSRIRQEAPETVRKQQQDFLATGETRRSTAVANIEQSLEDKAARDRATAESESAAFGQVLGLGLQQFPGIDKKSAATIAAVTRT